MLGNRKRQSAKAIATRTVARCHANLLCRDAERAARWCKHHGQRDIASMLKKEARSLRRVLVSGGLPSPEMLKTTTEALRTAHIAFRPPLEHSVPTQ